MKRLLLLVLLAACKPSAQENAPDGAPRAEAVDEGQAPSVQDVCLALKRTDIGCVGHYVTMQKSEPKKYGCAARCVTRDKNEAACASACGSTPASAVVNDPMAIPQ